METSVMLNEDVSGNLEALIEGLKQIIQAQKVHIRNLKHERDLLAEGYRAAVEKCDQLKGGTSGLAAQHRFLQ